MKLCLAIQSLRSCGLEEAAGIARALTFDALDLDGVMDTTLRRDKILGLDRAEIQRVRQLGLKAPNIHWTFSTGSLYPAINSPDPKVRQDNLEQIKRLVDFSSAAEIASILVLPGMALPGQGIKEARCRSAEALNDYVALAENAGIVMAFEPHVTSLFESPESAAWLAAQVAGAGIVLDYSHFVCQGYAQSAVDALIPHTMHIHLRQAKSGLLQTKLEDGTINFPLVFDALRESGYGGYLSVEYVHQNYIGADNVDVLTETVKMRDLVRKHVALD